MSDHNTVALEEREAEVFCRWRESLPEEVRSSFVTDGAVDPIAYLNSKQKILFLLKEVNDRKDDGGWCLCELLNEGERKPTWNGVTRWLRALRGLSSDIPWSELEPVDSTQRIEQLKSIAAMNLKKTPGKDAVDNNIWWESVNRDEKFIRAQFELYDADLVICCGNIVKWAFSSAISHAPNLPWHTTTRGVEFQEYKANKFVVAFSHPAARVAPNLLVYGLVDAVREILRTPVVPQGSGA